MKKFNVFSTDGGVLGIVLFQTLLISLANGQAIAPPAQAPEPIAVTAAVASPPPGRSFAPMNSADITRPISTPSAEEVNMRLWQDGTNEMANAAMKKAALEQRAQGLGVPMEVPGPNGEKNKLIGITAEGYPFFAVSHDAAAADTVSADNLWPSAAFSHLPWNDSIGDIDGNTLNGSGQVIGLWDLSGVPRTTHEQFGNRVQYGQYVFPPPTTIGQHATWVAGTLAASGFSDLINGFDYGGFSIGSGFSGTVDAYQFDSSQFTGEIENEASGQGMALSSHSYGFGCGWEFDGVNWIWYDTTTSPEDWKFGSYMGAGGSLAPQSLDSLSESAPYTLLVYSAGNDRNIGPGQPVTYYLYTDMTKSHPQTATRDWNNGDAGGYDSLNPTACAKDVLTVGGVYDIAHGYSSPSSVVSASFSSAGPTDDGRIKPDVVAPALRSGMGDRNSLGLVGFVAPDSSANNAYEVNIQGTSFSAPTVAGALGLVLQDRDTIRPDWVNNTFPVRSSTLRALAIHTADQAAASHGPSFINGYGLFDAQSAANLMAADANSGRNGADYGGAKPFVKEVLLQNSRTIQFHVNAASSSVPLKVTIAWTDPAGSPETLYTVDETTKRLVNDLDLRIISPDGTTTYYPWILNPDLTGKSAANRGLPATTGDDSINNVEQVQIDNPTTTGAYMVQVTYKGTLTDGSGHSADQWVSIISSGNIVPAVNFQITNLANNGNGNYNITWNSVVGGIFKVRGAPQITGPWSDATVEISADHESTTASVSAPNGNTQYYWRIARYY